MQARMRPSLLLLLLLGACTERPWKDVPSRAVDRSALGDVLLQAPPAGMIPVGAVFGAQAELVGYKLDPPTLVPGQSATLTLIWRCKAEMDPWRIFVHLDDANGTGGRIHAEHDPAQGRYPTEEIIVRGDRVEVQVHFATADLASLLPIGSQGPLTQAEIDRALPALVRLTLEGLSIASREGPCARENEARAGPDGPDGLLVEGAFRCPATPDLLRVRVRFIDT